MKKSSIINTSLVMGTLLCMSVATLVAINHRSFARANAASLPTVIDLRNNTAEEIKSYYSTLTSKSESELKGDNLLKNLKPIIKANMDYYSYDDVWKIYEITDRDWTLSPAKSDSANGVTYDQSSNKFTSYKYGTSNSKGGSNPYVHTLYRDHEYNSDKTGYIKGGEIKEWGDHDASGTNREHVWCQSRGFKASTGASGPAGTDVHHLISGDGYVNQSIHNNHPYGFVDRNKVQSNGNKEYTSNNFLGKSLSFSSSDKNVFEPQDSDKGDIARAIFYMAARYNNLANEKGVISEFEPFLQLANEITSEDTEYSSDTKSVKMGILQDLLVWHHMDPVDEYEIHRNNLIYNNYQHNRNPFIDYPEWVDYVWGTAEYDTSSKTIVYSATPTGSADLNNDVINGYRNGGSIPVVPTSEATSTSDNGGSGNIIKGVPNWVIFVAAGVVLVIVIILIFAGVLKVNKKGKVKLNTKKIVKTATKKSSSSNKGKKKK